MAANRDRIPRKGSFGRISFLRIFNAFTGHFDYAPAGGDGIVAIVMGGERPEII
jgi:hypothetical protein